jgi:hypothetical protein
MRKKKGLISEASSMIILVALRKCVHQTSELRFLMCRFIPMNDILFNELIDAGNHLRKHFACFARATRRTETLNEGLGGLQLIPIPQTANGGLANSFKG